MIFIFFAVSVLDLTNSSVRFGGIFISSLASVCQFKQLLWLFLCVPFSGQSVQGTCLMRCDWHDLLLGIIPMHTFRLFHSDH